MNAAMAHAAARDMLAERMEGSSIRSSPRKRGPRLAVNAGHHLEESWIPACAGAGGGSASARLDRVSIIASPPSARIGHDIDQRRLAALDHRQRALDRGRKLFRVGDRPL